MPSNTGISGLSASRLTTIACQCLLLFCLSGVIGCGGCWSSSTEKLSREELEKRAREREEALQYSSLVSVPGDTERKLLIAKPGHWVETRQEFKSNREDLQVVAVQQLTRQDENLKIPGTNFTNDYTRRTSLPKGQTKRIEIPCFVPVTAVSSDPFQATGNKLIFSTQLQSWPLMTPLLQAPSLSSTVELKEHEFQLAVLGPKANTYTHLTALDAVYWLGDELMMSDERVRSYFVTIVEPENNQYSLPKSMLSMTALAGVVWDDVSADDLSADQQRALIDWVHWGGQLIISGPSSWARLENSFLADYLPVQNGNAVSLDTSSFEELSQTWMVPDLNTFNTPGPLEIVGEPLAGISFDLKGDGRWLDGTGQLVAERMLGRGRIVVTRFPMNNQQVWIWPYYSSFFSTALLRRHPRVVRPAQDGSGAVSQFWAKPYSSAERDARMHSHFRILTRDLPLSRNISLQLQASFESEDEEDEFSDDDQLGYPPGVVSQSETIQQRQLGNDAYGLLKEGELNVPELLTAKTPLRDVPATSAVEAMQWGGRGAAWNDYSGLSYQALDALRAAAGIELPSKSTIMYLLAGYLVCLVPLNWLFFRALGKLEYAWVAAPLMAIVAVGIVTRVARLDIGFARRTTEIAVLELQGNHHRGHLTQYLALYTSLTTPYSVDFPENDSVALPLGDVSRSFRRAASDERELRTNYGRSDGVTLEPLTVYSNSTEMIHAEQMVDLAGGLRYGNSNADGSGAPAVKNETGLGFEAAMVIRRNNDDQIEFAWLGNLAADQTARLEFQAYDADQVWENWNQDPVTQQTRPDSATQGASEEDALWVGGVLAELLRKTPLLPGQARLFAYTNDHFSQLQLQPTEDQFDGRCLVVAHLTAATPAAVVPDLNIKSRGKSDVVDKDELEKEVDAMVEDEQNP